MNSYDDIEVIAVLEALGAQGVHQRSGTIRCACPIHGGGNKVAFASFRDTWGGVRFTCFSHQCCNGWGLERLVSKIHGTSMAAATKWVGDLLGRNDLDVPDSGPQDLRINARITADLVLYDEASLKRLRGLYPSHPYWTSRGFSQAAVDAYELTYRSLDNRAIIPVRNGASQLVGLMTRTFDPNDPVKYKWESANSNKGDFLFGLPQAMKHKRPGEPVFLVEGSLDTVKGWMAGYPLVASQTNRLSAAQAQDIFTRWDTVVVVPDNDEPGQCLLDSVTKHLSPFADVAVMQLPDGIKDLDSFSTAEEVSTFLASTLTKWRPKWKTPRMMSFARL